MIYSPSEEIWRDIPTAERDFEIVVAGDSSAPEATRIALLSRILLDLDELRPRAAFLLNCYEMKPASVRWILEAIEMKSAYPAEFEMRFRIEDDPKTKWRNMFREDPDGFSSIGFSRLGA